MMSGKAGTSGNKMVYAKGTFFWWRLFISSSRTIAYIVNKQRGICRKYLLLQGLCVPSVKTTSYVCNRFKMNSNLNEKFWNKSTLIWVSFPGVRFYPPTPTRLQVWKPYLHLNSHPYLASCIYDFFDQSVLTKILSSRKEVYIKLFLNRFMLIQLTFICSKPVTSFCCFYC